MRVRASVAANCQRNGAFSADLRQSAGDGRTQFVEPPAERRGTMRQDTRIAWIDRARITLTHFGHATSVTACGAVFCRLGHERIVGFKGRAMNERDDDLAGRVKRHDPTALADYLVEVRKPLSAFIERQLGAALRRKIEVDDVFQEVSIEALRALGDADFAHREPFSWLCQIAEHRIVDAHRRYFGAQMRDAGREVPLGTPGGDTGHVAVIDLLIASMTSPTRALSRKGREARLYEALASLPEEQREALRLRYIEGLASKEIAQRLGKSDGAIRVMLTRSLDRLQRILGPDDAPR